MIIRPPSLVRTWDTFFPGDLAFKQPPKQPGDDATTEERDEFKAQAEAYLATLRACRDNADWSALLVPDGQPTKFVMGQVDRNVWRELLDRATLPADSHRRIGHVTMLGLLFRLSVKSIAGWDKIERLPDPAWDNWTMAPASLVRDLDEINPSIVGELGGEVLERLKASRPF